MISSAACFCLREQPDTKDDFFGVEKGKIVCDSDMISPCPKVRRV
jgi:hypothetical protein